jgi:hypothetical protein
MEPQASLELRAMKDRVRENLFSLEWLTLRARRGVEAESGFGR